MNTPRTFTGIVVETRRRRFTVAKDNPRGERFNVPMIGRSLTPVCGDGVNVILDGENTAISAIFPRRNLFYRSDAVKQKLIAANVTQIAAVVAPDVAIDEMLLNRWIVAAQAASCRMVIVANKSDLPGFCALRERLQFYQALNVALVALSAIENAIALIDFLEHEETLLIGQSGMGKTTIVNSLIPEAAAQTREISETLGSGKHTTSATTLYPLPAPMEGTIIDVPGMSVFGLAHLDKPALTAAFIDIAPYAPLCRFRDCRHLSEPDCAVRQAVIEGKIHPKRLKLFHAILSER